MRLLRVQVPEFRALKDVDISFEPEFVPQVFPLGSLNGGGKSTLLQLIFVLLHCSINKKRTIMINYLLEKFYIANNENDKNLATFWIADNKKNIVLNFSIYNEEYLKNNNFIDPSFSFDIFQEKRTFLEEINGIKNQVDELQKNTQNTSTSFIPSLGYDPIEKAKKDLENKKEKLEDDLKKIELDINDFTKEIESHGYICITNLDFLTEKTLLLVKSDGLSSSELYSVLENIADKIFLASPASQPYIFFPKHLQDYIFTPEFSYENLLMEVKRDFTQNFFNYDFVAKYGLIKSLNDAIYKDSYNMAKTGQYGSNYKKLLDNINDVLGFGKKIEPQLEDSNNTSHTNIIHDILFKIDNNKTICSEDLSHGELKRLSIYVWLKTMPQEENIILMDEIENAFHPDWQRHIVDDLVEWGTNNQYILATHSYELCRGVTPAHIKELPPNLFPES